MRPWTNPIRPTLYEAHHDVWPISGSVGFPASRWTSLARSANPAISSHLIASCRNPKQATCLPATTAGAYGAVQAGTYNTRPLIAKCPRRQGEWAVVRPRLEVEHLIALDRLPPWLLAGGLKLQRTIFR